MHRIGFVTALPAEAGSLQRRRPGFDELAELPGGHLVIVSGTGPAHARQAASRLLDEGVSALVSWGCAAALDPLLKPGQLVVPDRIRSANGNLYPVDPAWRQRALSGLSPAMPAVAGVLTESPTVVANSVAKAAMRAATHAIAVDMESAAVAGVAEARGLPFLAIRAIADTASMALPGAVEAALTPRGDIRLGILFRELIQHPSQLPELISLGRAFGAAMTSLRRARHRLGDDFRLLATGL